MSPKTLQAKTLHAQSPHDQRETATRATTAAAQRADVRSGADRLSRPSAALRKLLEAAIARLRASSAPDAAALVAENEQLAASRVAQLELACEEFYLRRDRGESISASVFATRFPKIWRTLEAQLEGEDWIENEFADECAFAAEQLSHDEARAVVWPRRGERFLDYTVVKLLAEGGGSRVYLCRAERVGGRLEVVKISRSSDAFEAQTAGRLAHPHIMPLLGATNDDAGRLVLSMPFVARTTLCRVLDLVLPSHEGKPAELPPGQLVLDVLRDCNADLIGQHDVDVGLVSGPRSRTAASFAVGYKAGVVAVMLGVAEALAFAHRRQVLHLDLKPSNILIGAGGHPWLLDFDKARDRRLGRGSLGGTLPYMPPEQLQACCLLPHCQLPHERRGEEFDDRSDVFSFAVVLYELLTGKLPFVDCLENEDWDRPTAERYFAAQRDGRRGDVPLEADAALACLIDDCLHFDRTERPTSRELVARMTAIHHGLLDRAKRLERRKWFGVAASLAASAGFAATGAHLFRRAGERLDDGGLAQGIAKLKSGDLENALARFDRGIGAVSDRRLLAKLLSARARVREQFYWRAVRVDRSSANGASLFLSQAIEDLDRANDLAPTPQMMALIGYYHDLRFDNQLAIHAYENAGAQWRSAPLLHNLGACYLRDAKLAQASNYLSEALAIESDLEPALRHLAETQLRIACESLNRRGAADFGSAIANIEKAMRLGPPTGRQFVLATEIYASACRNNEAHRQRGMKLLAKAEEFGADSSILAELGKRLGARNNSVTTTGSFAGFPNTRYDAVETLDPLPSLLPAERV